MEYYNESSEHTASTQKETGVCKMLRYGLSLEGLSFAITHSHFTY